MKVLLDTHAFLWAVTDAPELSRKATRIFEDERNELFLSLASGWELAIKLSLGKLSMAQPLATFLPEQMAVNGIMQLPIELRHIGRVQDLPFHHRDPFDRLLIAQCLVEDLAILSADRVLDAYGVERVW